MSDKIIISFDDEKPEKSEEKIIIDIKSEKKEKPSEKFKIESVNCCYKGNPHLTGLESSSLRYPEGLENGFGKIFGAKLNDTFLNSILLNNKFVVLTSTTGQIFFLDRINGDLHSRHALANESFEKTGLVIDNNVFLNSVKSLYGFETESDILKEKKLYGAEDNFYIWSNLNKCGENIFFLEYSPDNKTANLVKCEIISENNNTVKILKSDSIFVSHFLFDSQITYENNIFVFCDNKILKYDSECLLHKTYDLKFNINADSNILLLDGKIYFNNENNELFYFDIANEDIKFTGIKCMYLNSLAGFNDNIIAGTLNGWYLFKTGGVMLFSYEDIKENKIETLNKNILAVSNENKIVLHNLNKFYEAEGITISPDPSGSGTDKIVSARIGEEAVFVLSKNGMLEAYNNNKLNLLID
jgi:hypothetical protein